MEGLFRSLISSMLSNNQSQASPMAKSLIAHINSDVDNTNSKAKKLTDFKWLLSNPNLTDLNAHDLAVVLFKLAENNWLEGLTAFKEALARLPPATVLAAGRKYAIKYLDVPKVEDTLTYLSAGLVGVGPDQFEYSLLVPDPESYLTMMQNNSGASLLRLFQTGQLDDVKARFEAKYRIPSLIYSFETKSPDLMEYLTRQTSDEALIGLIVVTNIKSEHIMTMLKLKSWPPLVAAILDSIVNDEELLKLLSLESAKAIPTSILDQILTILISNIIPAGGVDFGVGDGAEALNSCFTQAVWTVISARLASRVSIALKKGISLSGQSKDGWDSDTLAVIKRLVELGGQLPAGCEALVAVSAETDST